MRSDPGHSAPRVSMVYFGCLACRQVPRRGNSERIELHKHGSHVSAISECERCVSTVTEARGKNQRDPVAKFQNLRGSHLFDATGPSDKLRKPAVP